MERDFVQSSSSGLPTNESLGAAVMHALALAALALNDPDLSVIAGLALW